MTRRDADRRDHRETNRMVYLRLTPDDRAQVRKCLALRPSLLACFDAVEHASIEDEGGDSLRLSLREDGPRRLVVEDLGTGYRMAIRVHSDGDERENEREEGASSC